MSDVFVPFEWVPDRGLYVSYPCGEVSDAEGCHTWLQAHAALFERIGQRFDLIVIVDMFVIRRDLFETFMAHREVAYTRYIRHSVRVTAPTNPTIAPPTARIGSAIDIPSAMDLIDVMRAAALVGAS